MPRTTHLTCCFFFTYGGAWATNNLAFTGSGVGAVYTLGDSGFK